MIKGHSAGIGDILRSSAAWRVLKDRYPKVELHLLLLTREPGYPSEALIARHHLLAGFQALDKRPKGLAGWRQLCSGAIDFADRCRPDLIIDFEPHGLRTTLLARCLGRRCRAPTVGVAQVPFRGAFYDVASVSTKRFARQRRLPDPMDYTDRDFVVLSALGLERCETAIELRETEEGANFRREFYRQHGLPRAASFLGLNIGCGTPDAVAKRPSLALLSKLAARLQRQHQLQLVLTGAGFEAEANREFLGIHRLNLEAPVIDLAGKTTLLELAGLIRACRLFVSSDSGPYHMAVALRIPTLAIFASDNPAHFHHHPWVKCIRAGSSQDLPGLIEAAEGLLEQSWPAGEAERLRP